LRHASEDLFEINLQSCALNVGRRWLSGAIKSSRRVSRRLSTCRGQFRGRFPTFFCSQLDGRRFYKKDKL